jgi:hypothetical protein
LAYTEGDARKALFGEISELTTGNNPAPATLIGEVDLLTPVNLAEQQFLRLSVDSGRPVDINIAGAAPATTFLDEIIARINAVVPNLASATGNDRLCLTSPTTGEKSRLAVLPLRVIELIEYPPEPAQDPLPGQTPRAVRHGDRWSVENDGAAETDLKIVLSTSQGVFGPGFVNRTSGFRIRLMIVVHPNECVELWRESAGTIRAKIIKPDGTPGDILDAQILVEMMDEQKSCAGEVEGGEQDKAAALVLPQGRSEWAYLDCHGARFDRDRFNAAYFAGKECAEQGMFNISRFSCPQPSKQTSVFASTEAQSDPPIEVRFHWQQYRTGAFTVNLPTDLPERFGGRFNQARFAKAGDAPEEFKDVVTEPAIASNPDFLANRIVNSTLAGVLRFKVTEQALGNLKSEGVPDDVLNTLIDIKDKEFIGEEEFVGTLKATIGDQQTSKYKTLILKFTRILTVPRVPLGFEAATMPFRRPRFLTGGSDSERARLYLAEKDVPGFIELTALQPGEWGNAIAVAARKSGPARFDVTINYQAARFENARQVVLGGTELPALTEDLLKPSPVGVLQAKAGGIKSRVTRNRAELND